MIKLLLFLLLMVSTNVFAEWTRLSESADGDMTAYFDIQNIKRKGDKVKMWSLFDYKTVQKNSYGIYLSQLSRNEYDCEEETKRMLDFYWYSGNMRQGEIVYSEKNIKDEPQSILPESVDEISLKLACYKK